MRTSCNGADLPTPSLIAVVVVVVVVVVIEYRHEIDVRSAALVTATAGGSAAMGPYRAAGPLPVTGG